jgi:hypothetical protein
MNVLFVFPLMLAVHAVSAGFPEGRCYAPSCQATPYDMTWTSETKMSNGHVVACFNISSKGCIDTGKYNCCEGFANKLHKIKLSTVPQCERAVVAVTVNKTKKGGGIYFEKSGNTAELILTTLRISGSKAVNTRVCLTLKPPCNSIFDFCVEPRSGLCKFAMYNDPNHVCCPTCLMLDKSYEGTFSDASTPPPFEEVDCP